MKRQLKGLLYFYMVDLKFSAIVFWSVLLLILLLSMGAAFLLLNVEGGKFAFGFPFGTYVNAGIIGFLMVRDYMPYNIKLGAIRKNIYLANGVFFLGYSLFVAVISSTLQSIATLFIEKSDLHTMMILHPAMLLAEDTWFNRIVIDTAVMFMILSLLFLIGLLFYRGGLFVGASALGVLVVFILFGFAQGFLTEYFANLYQNIDLAYFLQVFAVGLVLYGVSYFLVRNITTVKVR